MTDLQLVLTVSIPSILILVGIFLNNARFNSIETRLITMEGDLRQFYRDLGKKSSNLKRETAPPDPRDSPVPSLAVLPPR